MTESRTLLAEYARSGSEAAFRELVNRYIGLVYGAALRLVEGDTHLAEDVAQTVFLGLARQAADRRLRDQEVGLGDPQDESVSADPAPQRRLRVLVDHLPAGDPTRA